jgi:tyrosine phenol-lyase
MAGGQPLSLSNLVGVRELTRAHGVPLILDATRISENALFIKDREAGHADSTLAGLIREIADLADRAVFSSKKDHFVPIGGLLAVNDDDLAERVRELVVVYEGFPHYGGLAGHDMETLAQHRRGDRAALRLAQRIPRRPSARARDSNCRPARRTRSLPRRETLLASCSAARVPRAGTRGGALPRRRRPLDGARNRLRPARQRYVRRARARSPHDPEAVYTQEHLAYVADIVTDVYERRELVLGFQMVYEPAHLRFFQARFEPRAPFLEPPREKSRAAAVR